MKASELIAIWKANGVTEEGLKHQRIVSLLIEGDDVETGTTPELAALSEKHERDNLIFIGPPSSCSSCRGTIDELNKDWVRGHRPNWWVCRQCKTVLPCRCTDPSAMGCYCECGRSMNELSTPALQGRRTPRGSKDGTHTTIEVSLI